MRKKIGKITLGILLALNMPVFHYGAEPSDWLESWRDGMERSASLRDAGRYDEAESLLRNALELVESNGPGTLRHARSLDDLAYLHLLAGRHDQAVELYIETVPMWERLLGKRQPRLATSLQNLAVAYINLEKYEEAEPVMLRALSIWKSTFGPDSAETTGALMTYESILRRTGRGSEADRLVTPSDQP
jgi:tetratricopeptide (TPR) repeat protein